MKGASSSAGVHAPSPTEATPMSGSSGQRPDREERLDEAVAAYMEAVELGQRPQRNEWLAQYPDLADELAEFIDDQEKVHRWTTPIRAPRTDRALGLTPRTGDPAATLHVPGGAMADVRGRFPNYQLLDEIARG